ncbi:hypothetical protein FB567DRAFT_621870 [Paraphoma chrysanthemicola]|uniref:Uncharacterized protein n=1 Tax=Paraphoma chrysanthemicola TaxID=798071 RepID=A0A8K0R9B7_9PLEO|nr:hypothetical protein FB567DRAFT_621870 [Paraphoma chrysanthemicola]
MSASWLSSIMGSVTSSARRREYERFWDSRDEEDWTFDQHTARLDPALVTELLPHMPSLFSKTLPPCGYEIQVAYQNMVHRLRLSWLHYVARTQSTENVPLHSFCADIKRRLELEQNRDPIGALHKTGERTPWRRETVFAFELRWADYFVREAGMMQRWPNLGEAERDRQQFMHRLFPIPKELKIVIKNKDIKREIIALWNTWNGEKRMDLGANDDEWQEVDDEEVEDTGKVAASAA